MSKVIDVAAGLIFRENRLLITLRLSDSHLGGLWEFPGGKVEPGETFESCLRRELFEELGVEAKVGILVESLTHSYPGKTVHLKFFRCNLEPGEPRPIGCADLRWVSPGELGGYEFPEADARLLERLRSDLSLWQ